MNFTLPNEVSVNGTPYPIRTDFRVILEIFVMLDDPDLSDADKTEALIRMFYMERPDDVEESIEAFLQFVDPRYSSFPRRRAQRSGSSSKRTSSGESELSGSPAGAQRSGSRGDEEEGGSRTQFSWLLRKPRKRSAASSF